MRGWVAFYIDVDLRQLAISPILGVFFGWLYAKTLMACGGFGYGYLSFPGNPQFSEG